MHASEIDPVVLAVGPATFIMTKITRSLILMLFAKLYPNLRRGGITLTVFFAFIVKLFLGQHLIAYLDLKNFASGISLGTMLKLAQTMVLCTLFISEKLVRPPGFEPGSSAWQADVLTKLDYGRSSDRLQVQQGL